MTTYKNSLTFMQRAAIEGEVVHLIITSSGNAEILFKLYIVLKSSPEDVRPLLLECFKSLMSFPEEVYFKILAEISANKVPIWLWENLVIDDIKYAINHGEVPEIDNLKLDKKALRKVSVKSSFILFCKRLCAYSINVPINLCRKILEDNELDFLHSSCFALINDLTEAAAFNIFPTEDTDENLTEILNTPFDARDLLSYQIEVRAMEQLDTLEKIGNKGNKEDSSNENSYVQDVLSVIIDVHNKEIETGKKRRKPFVVKKISNEEKAVITLKTFKSMQEAESYVDKVVDKSPDLMRTCTFIIEDFNKKDLIYIYSKD